jgi:hypothetical protein
LKEIPLECSPDFKRCTNCKAIQPHSVFTINQRNPDGRSSWCKHCRRMENQRYRKTTKGKDAVQRYRKQPENATKEKARKATFAATWKRRRSVQSYRESHRGRIINGRNCCHHRLGRAKTPEAIQRLTLQLTLWDQEIARYNKRQKGLGSEDVIQEWRQRAQV